MRHAASLGVKSRQLVLDLGDVRETTVMGMMTGTGSMHRRVAQQMQIPTTLLLGLATPDA